LEAGGLISYGLDEAELDRQLVSIIDKILRGAKPGDLRFNNPPSLAKSANVRFSGEPLAATGRLRALQPDRYCSAID